MRLERILSLVYSSPWAILPSKHQAIRAALDAYLVKGSFLDFDDDSEPAPAYEVFGTVAIVPIEGVILGKASTMEAMCGAFSLDQFKKTLKEISGRDDIKTVLLNIASGGGTITGLPEASNAIKALRASKNVVAYTDDCMASAAYWLGCNAKSLFMSQSAEIGSVGVYVAFLDESVAFAQEGLKTELFKSGAFKGLGIPGLSLSDEQKAYIQEGVDKAFAQFVSVVKANRPKVNADVFSAKMYSSDDAVKMGLADGIIDNLDDLIAYYNK